MSEQGKSDVQAFIAGLLGFVAVMAIGGGVMMARSFQQAKATGKPVAAAEPIDLGPSMPRPALSSPQVQQERFAQSPAPLIGAEEESEGAEAAESAPNAKSSSPRLELTEHLDKTGSGSSAKAVVKNTAAPVMAAKAAGKKASPKLGLMAGGSTASASVHYGVTSRNELMGRAAGPVYNFKGGAGKRANDVNVRVADLQRRIESSDLTADQRTQLQQELAEGNKDVGDGGKAQ